MLCSTFLRALVGAALLLFMALGCGPKVQFLKVGTESYPRKPADYEVIVFPPGERPNKEYKVIGMVFVEVEAGLLQWRELSDPKTINHLKKAAGKRGADAIFDLQFSTEPQVQPESSTAFNVQLLKCAEAKAIVFK
ncbi:MAG TPA: hypothetical protein VGA99_08440 [bacterium]